MIDPFNITNHNRSEHELQEFLLYSFLVSGKSASVICKKLDKFLIDLPMEYNTSVQSWDLASLPLSRIMVLMKWYDTKTIIDRLGHHGLGRQSNTYKFFEEVMSLWVRHPNTQPTAVSQWTFEEIQNLYGVGPKTARFFWLHSHAQATVAPIDTHAVKHLKEAGLLPEHTPTVTPSSIPVYRKMERMYIDLADQSGKTLADYDLQVWSKYATA